MLFVLFCERVEDRPVDHVFKHPFAGELPCLDFPQDLLHGEVAFWADNPWTAGEISILCSIRDRIPHLRKASFVNEINNQLGLVEYLQIRHLRCIARLDKGFKPGLDKGGHPTAEHRLFSEQVRFSLFAEARFQYYCAGCANPFRISKGNFLGMA